LAQSHAHDRAALRSVIASGAARMGVFPLTAAMSLVSAGLVLDAVGTASYGVVLLVSTLSQLLPFADLGVGAAVTRAVAGSEDPAHDPHVAATIRRSRRVLVLSGGVVVLIALVVGLTGHWASWLSLHGRLEHPELVTVLTLVLFALSLSAGLGQRLLLGVSKNHIAVSASITAPVIALSLTIALHTADVTTADWYVLTFPLGGLIGSVGTSLIARRVTGIHAGWRGSVDARVMPTALPVFILTVGVPIGLQSDRIVISHRLTTGDLSEYALATQLFTPGSAVLGTAAFALLPVFVRRRAQGTPTRALWLRVVALFVSASAIVAGVVVLLTPVAARIVSHDRIRIGLDLRLAFGALLVVQICGLVTGMVLNDPAGLRFQACCSIVMLVANLALSWVLAGSSLGVAGPVIASVVAITTLMTLPIFLRGLRVTSSSVAPLSLGPA
jgi:O-antigen/teichoic acid export membrane protein